MGEAQQYDEVVIGGGFYGCCLALFLRSVSKRVLLIEEGEALMQRASRVNQARVHTGFHYPRSALTAVKSMLLHRRFMADFPEAVSDDRAMLYAIAKRRSKISSKRFARMFGDLGGPIKAAGPQDAALFDDRMIDAVFECREAVFDYRALAEGLRKRLDAAGVEVRLGTSVEDLADGADMVRLALSDGSEVHASAAFNVTYSRINQLLEKADLPKASLKHEIAEIALVRPPEAVDRIGITVMDGPFFSCMRYPAADLHSLTHVRYTPHMSWRDDPSSGPRDPYAVLRSIEPESRVQHMIRDAARYVPSLREAEHVRSLYDVKTVLVRNEADDGRPILYQRLPSDSRVYSIMGGKIDNIYDLFDLVRQSEPRYAGADDHLVMGRAA